MGKRSNFVRNKRDFYPTPYEAVLPLLDHLEERTRFLEPCAGKLDLVKHLEKHDHECVWASDIDWVNPSTDARELKIGNLKNGEIFITNPPWPAMGVNGEPTLEILENLSNQAPTWLLLSADFCHNRYFRRVERRCSRIVSVGRVSWMGNAQKGKDNAAWYLFNAKFRGRARFYGPR